MRILLNFRVQKPRVRIGALSYVGVYLIIIFLGGCSTTGRSENKQEPTRKPTTEEFHFLPMATSYSCWPCGLSKMGRSSLPNEDQQANYFEAGADIPIVAELENDKNQRFYMKPPSVRSKKDLALPAARALSPSDFTITLAGSEWEKKGTFFMIEGYPHFRWGEKLNPEVVIEGMDDVEINLRIQYKNGPILTRKLRPNTINTWGLPPKLAHIGPLQLDTSLTYVVDDDGMFADIDGREAPSTSKWGWYSQREKPNGYQEKLLGIKADAWNVIEFDFTQGIGLFSGKQCTGVHPSRLMVTGQNLDVRKQGCQLQIRAQQITGPHSLTVVMVGAPEVYITIPVGIKPMQANLPLSEKITRVSWGHIKNARSYQDRTKVLPGDRLGYSLKFHDQWYEWYGHEDGVWQKLQFKTSQGIHIERGPTTRQRDDPEFYVVIDGDLANALTGALTMEVWYEGRRDLAKSLEYTLDSTSLYSPYLFKANKDTLEKRTGRVGRQGRDGRKGIDGRSAQFQSRANGEHGGDGEAGRDGHNGKPGVSPDPLNLTAMQVKGLDGQDYVLFGFQRGEEAEEISLLLLGKPWKVNSIGGPGGQGGRGGHGGAGGDGGTGDMNLRGGNGGQGADAGNGGDGGDAADGGDIRLEITDRKLETMFQLTSEGGHGGAPGEGGTGGRAGSGGHARMNGRNGKDGRAGRDGSSGYRGRNGQPGHVEVNIANTASKLWSRASADMRALLVKPAL